MVDKQKVIIIGNSGVLLDTELGFKIDNSGYEVARFNDYVIKGYEKNVGTRADWWFGNSDIFALKKYVVKNKIFIGYSSPSDEHLSEFKAQYIGDEIVQKTRHIIGTNTPSSGVLSIIFFLERNYEISLCGFDNYNDKRVHYYENDKINANLYLRKDKHHHGRVQEKAFIDELIKKGLIKWLN